MSDFNSSERHKIVAGSLIWKQKKTFRNLNKSNQNQITISRSIYHFHRSVINLSAWCNFNPYWVCFNMIHREKISEFVIRKEKAFGGPNGRQRKSPVCAGRFIISIQNVDREHQSRQKKYTSHIRETSISLGALLRAPLNPSIR